MRPISGALLAAALLALLTTPALAAEPRKPLVIDLNDPAFDAEDSAFWTEACGFPVTADVSGHIIVHNEKRGSVQALTVFHITETLTSVSGTYRLVDVGPDILFTRDGTTYVAVVGRSITGSGVIGRVLVNADTGEILSVSGRVVGDAVFGDFTVPICRALAPAA